MSDSNSSIAEGVQVQVCGQTDVGQLREHNEDNLIIAQATASDRAEVGVNHSISTDDGPILLAVCDGMGGAAAGEVASQLAVDLLHEYVASNKEVRERDRLAAVLVRAIEEAGIRIFNDARADRSHRGMGTTATAAALIDGRLFVGQVGDSRAYLLRGSELVQITRDQSLVNQLIEAGQLTEEEAEHFEHNNIILQALGTADTVQVDLTSVELVRGDTLMLCSDGLSGMIRAGEIREVLMALSDPIEACRELIERANLAGGHDNITVIVAKFEGDNLPASAADVEPLAYSKYALEQRIDSSSPARPSNWEEQTNDELTTGEIAAYDDHSLLTSGQTPTLAVPKRQSYGVTDDGPSERVLHLAGIAFIAAALIVLLLVIVIV